MSFWAFVNENPGWTFLYLWLIGCAVEAWAKAFMNRK